MKKILFLLILWVIIFGCEKSDKVTDNVNVKFNGVTLGYCALHDSVSYNYFPFENDTVIYNFKGDSLTVMVGFVSHCGANYYTNANIINDTILMSLYRHSSNIANCECYFTYNFQFSSVVSPHHYKVHIDNYLYFSGYIEP